MRAPQPVVLEGRFVRLEPLGVQHRSDLVAAVAEDPEAVRLGVGRFVQVSTDDRSHEAPVSRDEERGLGGASLGDLEKGGEGRDRRGARGRDFLEGGRFLGGGSGTLDPGDLAVGGVAACLAESKA